MRTMLMVGTLILGAATGAFAQSGQSAADAVKAAELRRFSVMTARDYAALATLLADDLVYTHSSASVDSKTAYLESLTSKRVTYQTITPSDLSVRVYGNTAIINGTAAMTVDVNGQVQNNNLRFTDVWVQRDGRWQMVAWQSTRIP